MSEANAIPTTPEPHPSRRGAIFYGTAVLAGMTLGGQIFPDADPVDAAIAAFRKASFDLQNCPDDESAEWERLVYQRYERQLALARTAPTSRDGAHKLMSELVLDELGGDGLQGDSPIIIAIGTLLQALPHLA